MNPEKILGDIDLGIPRADVTVFRFLKNRALMTAILSTLTGVVVLGAATALAPSIRPDAGSVRYGATAFVGLVALSAFWLAWRKATEIRDADRNVLVVAPEGVVRRLRGRVQSWPFAQFPDITFVVGDRYNPEHSLRIALGSHKIEDHIVRSNFYSGKVSAVYLNEPGADFQHELVDDGIFGPMNEILAAIALRGLTRS
jgi:hypothetical protein